MGSIIKLPTLSLYRVALALCFFTLCGTAMAEEKDTTTTPKKDLFDALKNKALTSDGTIYVGFGGQLRIRSEFSRNPVFGLVTPERNDGLLVRSFLAANFHLGPYLSTFIELGTGQAPIWNGTPPATQFDRLDFMQGYSELTLSTEAGSFLVRAGRQEMSFGSSRLVSVRESPTSDAHSMVFVPPGLHRRTHA